MTQAQRREFRCIRSLATPSYSLTTHIGGGGVDGCFLPADLRAASPAQETDWLNALQKEVERALNRGEQGIMDELTRQFEKALIARALAHTGGRRIEAATLLGLGRNTLTRKIQELGLEDRPDKAD